MVLEDVIVEVVEGAKSWRDLQEAVLEKNILGLDQVILRWAQDPEVLYSLITGIYSAVKPREESEAQRSQTLPGTVVVKNGTTFVVHGIRHDLLHGKVLKKNLSQEGLVVGEPGLWQIYKGPNFVGQKRGDELKYIPDMFAYNLGEFRTSIKTILTDFAEIRDFLARKHVNEQQIREYRSKFSLSPIDCYNLPIGLEQDFILYCLEKDSNHAPGDLWLRSLSEAEFFENISLERGAAEAHWIGGTFHEPQIAHFLRNEDFARELRHRYGKPYARLYVSPAAATIALPFITAFTVATCFLPLKLAIVTGITALVEAAYLGIFSHMVPKTK